MFSEFEREMIVARVNAGLARRDEVIFPAVARAPSTRRASGRHRMRAAPISPNLPPLMPTLKLSFGSIRNFKNDYGVLHADGRSTEEVAS
jgi:hypothetical protein